MRGWTPPVILALSLLCSVIQIGAAQGDDFDFSGCKIDHSGVDCREQQKKDGFWTGPVAQTIYAILGLGATGAAGFFTTQRIRRRRRELRVFLNDVETSYAQAKADPVGGLPRLEALRRGLTASHTAGKLDDPQFLEMDRRLRDYITRIRMLQLERAFPHLPMAMFTEVRTVLSDGQLSAADLALVEKRATQLSVSSSERSNLLAHLRRWAPGVPEAKPSAPRRLAVVAK